jgi:Raf kinase inhibitor-like YbhB/YbcL family protein
MTFRLTSPSFEDGQKIPERYVRRGANISPRLQWEDPPPGTQSYVLVVDDPDARHPGFRHWAVYDIPPERRQLAEGMSSGANTETLAQGFNDFGNAHYDGPDPPASDPPHTYRFRLAALGVPSLEMGSRPDAGDVWEAARQNMLAEADLTGKFGKS